MRTLLELVAPTLCVACGSPADGDLCGNCAVRVVVLRDPFVPSFAPGRALSLVAFAEPARGLTLRLKRRGATTTAQAIGSLLSSLVRREGIEADSVTFVPAASSAARRRGFDHTELLATAIARDLGLPVTRLLRRIGEGPRQADVPLTARRDNVRNRFTSDGASGRIMLVDDVFTTGATAEACATALLSGGATSVDVVTWARTLLRRLV